MLKEHIELKQHGVIEICFKKEEKFMCFYNVFIRLKRLIEIASLKKVNLEKVTAYSEEVTEQIEEESISRTALDIMRMDASILRRQKEVYEFYFNKRK